MLSDHEQRLVARLRATEEARMNRVVRLFAVAISTGVMGGAAEAVDWNTPQLLTIGYKHTRQDISGTEPSPGGGQSSIERTLISLPAQTAVPQPGYLELDGLASERYQVNGVSDADEHETSRVVRASRVTANL